MRICQYFSLLGNIKGVLAKANLERKRCAGGHENNDFDTTTASKLELSFDSKGYGVKNPTFYVLDLVCLTSRNILYVAHKLKKFSKRDRGGCALNLPQLSCFPEYSR